MSSPKAGETPKLKTAEVIEWWRRISLEDKVKTLTFSDQSITKRVNDIQRELIQAQVLIRSRQDLKGFEDPQQKNGKISNLIEFTFNRAQSFLSGRSQSGGPAPETMMVRKEDLVKYRPEEFFRMVAQKLPSRQFPSVSPSTLLKKKDWKNLLQPTTHTWQKLDEALCQLIEQAVLNQYVHSREQASQPSGASEPSAAEREQAALLAAQELEELEEKESHKKKKTKSKKKKPAAVNGVAASPAASDDAAIPPSEPAPETPREAAPETPRATPQKPPAERIAEPSPLRQRVAEEDEGEDWEPVQAKNKRKRNQDALARTQSARSAQSESKEQGLARTQTVRDGPMPRTQTASAASCAATLGSASVVSGDAPRLNGTNAQPPVAPLGVSPTETLPVTVTKNGLQEHGRTPATSTSSSTSEKRDLPWRAAQGMYYLAGPDAPTVAVEKQTFLEIGQPRVGFRERRARSVETLVFVDLPR